MAGVLQKVIDQIDPKELSVQTIPVVKNDVASTLDDSPTITQAWFWPRIGEFLIKDDLVVTETGTSNFGIWDTKFPQGVTALSQVLWGSIGWSVGACQGAALAAKDMGGSQRTILFVGDGSFQLTAQELSTMIRHGLKPIMYVVISSFICLFIFWLLSSDVNIYLDLSYAMIDIPSNALFMVWMPSTTTFSLGIIKGLWIFLGAGKHPKSMLSRPKMNSLTCFPTNTLTQLHAFSLLKYTWLRKTLLVLW